MTLIEKHNYQVDVMSRMLKASADMRIKNYRSILELEKMRPYKDLSKIKEIERLIQLQ